MSYPSRVVLICCGSFNPITNMHLRMFELARDKLHRTGKYKVIGGIISPVNDAYEKKGLVASSHRIEMIRQAIKTSDWIKLDTWEADKSNWTETFGVLKHHKDLVDSLYNANANSPSDSRAKRRKIGTSYSADEVDYCIPKNHVITNDGSGPIEVKLLCGADLLESFAVPGLWKDEHIEAIVGKHGIVVISRAGSNPEQFIYDSDVLSKHQHNITIVTEWIQNEVSATKIRKALRRGESVKYLLQDTVIDYIMDKKLYGAGDNKYLNSTTPSPGNDVESYTSCHGNLCKSDGDLDMTHHSNFLSPTIGYGNSVVPNNAMISRFKSQDFIQDEYYYSSSEYETDSPNRTPYKRPTSMGNSVGNSMGNIGGVVRRFRNMRVTTPETPV